jgi:FtsH-binding integral membrane protein
MANWQDPQTTGVTAATVGVPRAARDAGLRSYMLSVYNYMASGVLLTGIVAFGLAATGIAQQIFFNGGLLRWVALFAPLAYLMLSGRSLQGKSLGSMQVFYWTFAALMGVSMSVLPLLYTGVSIAQTFFATAAAYGGLSLYGYTTKRDLGPIGTFLHMAVWGLLIVMLLNIGIVAFTGHGSRGADMLISAVGVLLFAGLTAADTQKVKSMYFYAQGSELVAKSAIMGALTLYLDFVNMFQFLLSFMGNRR